MTDTLIVHALTKESFAPFGQVLTHLSCRTRTQRPILRTWRRCFFPKQGKTPALPGKRTDVLLRPQGYTLLFECKRPRSPRVLSGLDLNTVRHRTQEDFGPTVTSIFQASVREKRSLKEPASAYMTWSV